MALDLASSISLVKTAAGVILNQKPVAIYLDKADYEKDQYGINVSQILGGLVGDEITEVLAGATIDGLPDIANSIVSYLLSTMPMNANMNESSQIMEHPVEMPFVDENGRTVNYIADHQIKMPVEITIMMLMPSWLYVSVMKEAQKYKDEKTQLMVLTKLAVYHRMYLTHISYPHEPQTISRVPLTLTFKEVQGKYNDANQTASPSDTSVQK